MLSFLVSFYETLWRFMVMDLWNDYGSQCLVQAAKLLATPMDVKGPHKYVADFYASEITCLWVFTTLLYLIHGRLRRF